MEAPRRDPQGVGVTTDDLGLCRVLTFDTLRAFNQAFTLNPFFDEEALPPIVRKVRPSPFFC